MRSLQGLALCAGIGGLELGIKRVLGAGYRTVCYVEREAFCASILAARMADGRLDNAPIWSDLSTFDAHPWRGRVDFVSGGYPCQPFSLAGNRQGDKDPRHLWPRIAAILEVLKPRYCFFENVPGHVSLGLRDVCADLRCLGYRVEAGIFSAAECGAPHVRKRLFIFAHAHYEGPKLSAGRTQKRRQGAAQPGSHGSKELVADAADGQGQRQPGGAQQQGGRRVGNRRATGGGTHRMAHADGDGLQQGQPETALQLGGRGADGHGGRLVEPAVGGGLDGLPAGLGDALAWGPDWEAGLPRTTEAFIGRVDQLRALGNAVVPAQAALALRTLMGVE